MSERCSLLTDPWWARASSAGAPRPAPAWAITWAGIPPASPLPRPGAGMPCAPVPAISPRRSPPAPTFGSAGSAASSRRSSQISLSRAVNRSAKPPRVGEHQRRAMGGDEIDDPLLDMRPDRRPGRLASGRPGQVAGRSAQLAEIGHRDDDLQIPLLRRGRGDDVNRTAPGQEPRDLLDRAHRRGQADPLRGPLQQRRQGAPESPPGALPVWCLRRRGPRRG
jgi:hypothetical protein